MAIREDLLLCLNLLTVLFVIGNRALALAQEDVIDLVNSPRIEYPGVVTLDSDEEIAEIRIRSNSTVDSPQFDNNEITVKVNFGEYIDEFTFRRVS